jgi:hypothetical protein
MIACIFTLDYEIYGNGEGALQDLVLAPAQALRGIFDRFQRRFVTFVEVAELERIEARGTDPAIGPVRDQVRELYEDGFELGLHLHPQWCNARHERGRWLLDYSEYNLCTLPPERIGAILDGALRYLGGIIGREGFAPTAFRAGNWLLQPSHGIARILAERGIRLDSSVFKGARQRAHGLDYRRAPRDDYYWMFGDRVEVPDARGALLEIPTYTKMVPFWRMLGAARRGGARQRGGGQSERRRHLLDVARVRYPMKLDYCRRTFPELREMVDDVRAADEHDPARFRPIVAIGHTKDFTDSRSVHCFLSYLLDSGIEVSTFDAVYARCMAAMDVAAGPGCNRSSKAEDGHAT